MSEENVEEFEDGLVEFTTTSEYIAAAFNALASIDGMDMMIMNKQDEMRIKRIRRKSLRIIDECISEMYNELFEDDEE